MSIYLSHFVNFSNGSWLKEWKIRADTEERRRRQEERRMKIENSSGNETANIEHMQLL